VKHYADVSASLHISKQFKLVLCQSFFILFHSFSKFQSHPHAAFMFVIFPISLPVLGVYLCNCD